MGCFNWSDEGGATRPLNLARIGADPANTYLIYDFWEQRPLTEARGKLQLQMEPSSVKLLGIRPQQNVPQVLGTDRHFTQGGLELENVHWDEGGLRLSGTGWARRTSLGVWRSMFLRVTFGKAKAKPSFNSTTRKTFWPWPNKWSRR